MAYQEHRKQVPTWCHCEFSSKSSFHDACIECGKYIPSGYEIAGQIESRLEQAEGLIEYIDLERSHLPECRSRIEEEYECKCMDRRYYNKYGVTRRIECFKKWIKYEQ